MCNFTFVCWLLILDEQFYELAKNAYFDFNSFANFSIDFESKSYLQHKLMHLLGSPIHSL